MTKKLFLFLLKVKEKNTIALKHFDEVDQKSLFHRATNWHNVNFKGKLFKIVMINYEHIN